MVKLTALYLIFSHRLTADQEKDAFTELGVERIHYLPQELQAIWSNVPPELPHVSEFIQPIKDWLKKHVQPGDYLLVQGDYGATYQIVKWALVYNCIPVYATTERKTVETIENGLVTIVRLFEHVRFRFYEEK